MTHRNIPIPRSLPYPLIILLITQFLMGTWYVSKFDSRAESQQKSIDGLQRAADTNNVMIERMARVETQIQAMREEQGRLATMINKIFEEE